MKLFKYYAKIANNCYEKMNKNSGILMTMASIVMGTVLILLMWFIFLIVGIVRIGKILLKKIKGVKTEEEYLE